MLLAALTAVVAGCRIPQLDTAEQPESGPDQTPGSPPDEEQPESDPIGMTPQDGRPDLSVAAISAAEGDGTLRFTVSLSRTSGEPVSVAYRTEGGTATAGVDYEPARGRLTFAAESTEAQMIEVTVIDDQVDEAAETLTVRLSDPQGVALRVATAMGTIIDDDQRALLVEPRERNVPEGGTGSYRVMLGSKPTGPVMARVLEPAEVSVDPKELQFTPADWSIAQAVEVTAAQDPDSRPDPPVVLLHEVSGGDYDGTTASVRVTVVEDDAATLAVSGGRTAEGGRRLNFQVTLSIASSMEVTVDYATGVAGDTATTGLDYAPARGTVTFAAGSTATQTIDVTVYDDTIDEPDEQVTVTLRNARNALLAGGGDTASAIGTIEDDDDPPRVSIGDSSLTEGAAGGAMRFAVTLERATNRTATVRYETADLTASAGADYTRASGTLTFDPGERTRTIAVAVTDDTLDEPDEELTVTLSAAVHATLDAAGRTATGTIRDNDGLPSLSIDDSSAAESAGTMPFIVTLAPPSGQTVTVFYETWDGQAEADLDFRKTEGELTFRPGAARHQTVSVPILQDDLDEGAGETFELRLLDPVNATLGDATATGSITDDDDAPSDDHGNTRATATSIAQGSPISGRLETATDVDFFKVTVTSDSILIAATDPRKAEVGDPGYTAGTIVRIEGSDYFSSNNDAYDSAQVDLGLVASADIYVRVSGPESGASATRYDVAVWVLDPNESDTSFDIELRYLGTTPTAAQRQIIRAAADEWESIITSGLAFSLVRTSQWKCPGGPSAFGDYIDDLRIDIRLERIDGVSGTLAKAGPCVWWKGGLPFIGDVTLDTADLGRLATTVLRRLVVHEMAHSLGFGTSVQWDGLLRDSAEEYLEDNPGATTLPDTHFVGSAAVSAFDELLDGATYDGKKVPVENDTAAYGSGGLDGHWRETVFDNELMTASISISSSVREPRSKVTIAALADLGYSVDYTQAESYTLPSESQSRLRSARAAEDEMHVGDDIRSGPIVVAELPDQHIPVISP